MAASYKKLFKMLIDREMKSKDLAAKAGISPATLAKIKTQFRYEHSIWSKGYDLVRTP